MQYLKMDIDSSKEYALFLVELIISAYPESPKKDISFFRKVNKESIESAHTRGTLSGLKMVISDLEMQIKLLDSRLVAIANTEIKKRFGFTLSQKKESKKAGRILERGFLKSEQEYRFLNDYYELISVDESNDQLYLKKIGKMLDEFNIG